MKITKFNPPALQDDFGDEHLLAQYSAHISGIFNDSVSAVQNLLNKHDAGLAQFYNPLTHGHADADTAAEIVWNGFPRRFASPGPGQPARYADAEPDFAHLPTDSGIKFRPQDEYLEWYVHRNHAKKIVAVDFTCEAYDYFEFLGAPTRKPDVVVDLFKKYVSPHITKHQLFEGSNYNPWSDAHLKHGAMHLTHPANALGAEIKLAADATVRRKGANGQEPPNAKAMIDCAQYGDSARNSDPKIGFQVNQLAREGFLITLADPVGLYMVDFDDSGWAFANGQAATGFFKLLRGTPGFGLRARYELPHNLAAQGLTVSDITIGGVPIAFGGQIAEHITMGIKGLACKKGSLNDKLVRCGELPFETEAAPAVAAVAAQAPKKHYSRRGNT